MVRGLLFPLESSTEIKAIWQGIEGRHQQLVYGVSGAQTNYLVAGLKAKIPGSLLVVTASALQARKSITDLETFLPGKEIVYFPPPVLMPYNILAHSKELTAQRLKVLAGLAQGREMVVVAPVEALSKLLTPVQTFRENCLSLSVGGDIQLDKLAGRLNNLGYERVQQVEGMGQFSIRGGIVDIFPLDRENPIRIELFDNEIDSIRSFDALGQRSLEKLEQVGIIPARELVLTEASWATALVRLKADWTQQNKKLEKAGRQEARLALEEKMARYLEQIEEHIFLEGLEQFGDYFNPEGVTLLDYLPTTAPICIDEAGRVKDSAENAEQERAENWANWLEKGLVLPGQAKNFRDYTSLFKAMQAFPLIGFALLPKQPGKWSPQNIVNVLAKSNPSHRGQTNILIEDLRRMRKNEYAAVILADTQERCQRIIQTMRDARLDALYLSSLDREVRPGNIIITEGTLQNGFELTNCKISIFTDAEIYGSQKKGRKHQVHRQQSKLAAFADLNVGDYVVHVNHGIGMYQGVQKLEVAGIHKDYLLVKYAGEDRLYVPNEQVGMLQKYLGAEGQKPKLSKLGGTEWSKVKSRVKESVQSMAQELIQLYADRQSLKGFAFGPDTVWQQEFEETFPYEETPDQIQAVAEIKTNMELPKPMDRLLCGDVGYGKTEVAIRAAFKAVMEGKQVAVLVPTTILAQQHFNTFHQRFANFPVTIEMLSRFRSPKEQRQTLSKMLQGQVDIVIGTHRLVQEDIVFKDLGLVIVDEEQRFGVAHKERLKQLRHSVDVLTLTATPIPRTLHMSLVGVRDMSLLETPPEDRYPVQTYVVEFNYQVIRDAILRELNRGGQTYFVHNRVMDIERVAEALQEIIPEARIAVAHGQMKEDDLERIMLDFLEGEFDVLLCTTIIETGLDIPNVNTIIIDEADHMGLSQLYQLRGRVGRSNRLAYAYLTYKKDKILTEIAEKRLQAIREFTEFGSGFKIAMRDLEIRGAGNILGPEQHGQIMSVGFEMYCRLLEEAVQELQGKQVTEIQEPAVEIAIDAFISDDYIPDQIRKMEMYRKIMLSRMEESVDEVVEELVDRFGDPPQAVQNLLIIARIKALCYELGLAGVTLSGEYLTFKFNEKPAVSGQQLVELAGTYRSLSFVAAPQIQMKLRIRKLSPEKVINEALGVLTQIKKALANQPI